jgi:hypothetical protein
VKSGTGGHGQVVEDIVRALDEHLSGCARPRPNYSPPGAPVRH